MIVLAAGVAEGAFTTTTGEWMTTTWDTEDGLPENSATAITQTPDGYLWIGSFNGLVRFNGVDFTVFNPANTLAMPSASVVGVHCDRSGRLWVATYRGIVVREGTRWRRLSETDGKAAHFVRSFAERSNGDLLVTTFGGEVFEFSAGKVSELPPPPGEAGQGYLGGADEDGHWWVVQDQFIGRWENGRWVQMLPPPGVARDTVGCAPGRGGGMWLALGKELRRLEHGKEVARLILPETPGAVWGLSEDSRGNVWIATHDKGVCRVRPNGAMQRWDASNGGSDHSRCVFEDEESNLWVGTGGDGLRRLTPGRFAHYSLGKQGSVVNGICLGPGSELLAATYGAGLFHLSSTAATNVTWPGLAQSTGYLQSVLADRSGRLLVGTFGEGLWLVDNDGARRVPPDQTGGNNILALFEDSRARIWVSGGHAIAMWDGKTFHQVGPEQGLPDRGVVCFAEDASGVIWLSNGGGVYRLSQDRHSDEVKDAAGDSVRGIACLKADSDGSMWLGSSDRGLLRWKEGRIAGLSPPSGFPVSAIQGMVEDKDGFLWMTSGRSLVRAANSALHAAADGERTRLTCQVLDSRDGLPKAEFSGGRQPTSVRDRDGRLWFATTKGVVMTDPAAFEPNPRLPPVHVEEITFRRPAPQATTNRIANNGHRAETAVRLQAPFETPITLPAGSRRIEIRYAALCLRAPEKARYEVRLMGQDKDWQDMGQQHTVYYHELPPRDYLFQVRAANNDGLWNQAGASLPFTVQPFFWQRRWFQLGLGSLFLGLAMAAVGWQARRRHHRQLADLDRARQTQAEFSRRLIESQEAERKRIAADLHDGLGQNLLLIKNRLRLMETEPAQPADLARQVREISSTASSAIAEVRAISTALRPPAIEQIGLTMAIQWMVDQVAAGQSTRFATDLEPIDGLLGADREIQLFRIIQEGLNNVVKHANATHVILEVKRQPARIYVSLFDDGRGFDAAGRASSSPSPAGTGFGLSCMAERARVLGGSLDLQSSSGRGTRLTVTIPLQPTRE